MLMYVMAVAILAQAICFVLSAVRVACRSWAWTQAPRHSVLAQRNAVHAEFDACSIVKQSKTAAGQPQESTGCQPGWVCDSIQGKAKRSAGSRRVGFCRRGSEAGVRGHFENICVSTTGVAVGTRWTSTQEVAASWTQEAEA